MSQPTPLQPAPLRPALVTVAHGTRVAVGNRVARAITGLARRRLGVPGQTAYVELCRPLLNDVLAAQRTPTVVVPLLLSTGHHMAHDLPAAVAAMQVPTVLTDPLGPHPLLAEVQVRRLLGARARPDQSVVIVAAGSEDPLALVDLEEARRLLERRWDGPVRIATLSGHGPRVEEVVAQARLDGPVAISPYLMATGHFHRQATLRAARAGAWGVAGVLGPDPLIAELVARRYLAAARARTTHAA